MKKFRVSLQYHTVGTYGIEVDVPAESFDEARLKVEAMDEEGLISYSASYLLRDPMPTESFVTGVEEVKE